MRILAISDLDINRLRLKNEDEITYLLTSTSYDILVLSGGLLSNVGFENNAKNRIISTINKVSKFKKVIWINPENDSCPNSQKIIPLAEMRDSFTYTSYHHKKFKFMHIGKKYSKLHKFFLRINSKVNKYLKISKNTNILEEHCQDTDVLVISTHNAPEYYVYKNKEVYGTGSIIDSRTYIYIDESDIMIRHLRHLSLYRNSLKNK
jgi:hypothetical protein